MSINKLPILTAAACALALGALANSAHAAPFFLVNDTGTAPNGSITLATNQSDYAQFVLTGPGTTGPTMTATLKDAGGGTLDATSNFSASIVNDNAGVPGATTILSSTSVATAGTLSASSFLPISFNIPTGTAIPAGTYWLKISHANVAEDGALFGVSTTSISNTGNDGTISQKVYDGTSTSADFGILSVSGSAAPVPEPMSLSLLSLGAVALLRRRPR